MGHALASLDSEESEIVAEKGSSPKRGSWWQEASRWCPSSPGNCSGREAGIVGGVWVQEVGKCDLHPGSASSRHHGSGKPLNLIFFLLPTKELGVDSVYVTCLVGWASKVVAILTVSSVLGPPGKGVII